MTSAEFKDYVAVHNYAEAHGLEYVWEGTKAFETRKASLSPDQFEVHPVRTRKGITNVLLFSKEIRTAEAQAYRKRMRPQQRAWYRRAMASLSKPPRRKR